MPVPPRGHAGVRWPHHHVRDPRVQLLVTARAAVRLGGRRAGHRAHDPVAVWPVLDPLGTKRRGRCSGPDFPGLTGAHGDQAYRGGIYQRGSKHNARAVSASPHSGRQRRPAPSLHALAHARPARRRDRGSEGGTRPRRAAARPFSAGSRLVVCGVPVIAGHPWRYLTRVTHDQRDGGKGAGAKGAEAGHSAVPPQPVPADDPQSGCSAREPRRC